MSDLINNLKEYWLVHLLLTLYTALLAYHAFKGNRETKGVVDYYIGGRSMTGWVIGLSFFATYSSTNSFVGFAGKGYSWGAPWLLLIPFVVGFSLLAWLVVAKRLRDFTEVLDSLTIPDFIGFRFGSNAARVLAAVIVLFASFFYMTAVFKGIGNLLEAFLHIPYRLAIVIVFFIVVTYTVVGGFISVVKTDAVQGIVMIFAAVLLFSGTVNAAGGVETFFSEVSRSSESGVWDGGVAIPFLLGVLFAGTIKFVVEPRQLSRFYALKSQTAVKTGVWVSTISFAVVYVLLVPVGILARRILPTGITDSDRVVPELLTSEHVFSDGVSAFLLLAMVAAAMSSLDSVLLVMASTAQRDIVGFLRKSESEKSAVFATRSYVALFAFITMLIALNPPGGIVGLTAFSGALYAACFLPAVILGLYWRGGNGAGVMVSFIGGLAVLLLWRFIPSVTTIHQVFPAVLLSLVLYLVVSVKRGAGPNNELLDRLFSSTGRDHHT
ncbi:sodium/solute symporter [bacterium]|nr:sodium/solute symporter [bacterium]